MNQNEKDLFLQLCKFRNPNKKRIERLLTKDSATPELLGMLFANRVAGIAGGVLKETELLDQTDREFRNALQHATMLSRKINEDYIGCLKFLSVELDNCGVPYALLKGAYLCPWYPAGYRISNDIDVLVSPDDVGKISSRLKLAGFRQGHLKNGQFVDATRQEIIESKMMRGETVPFIKKIRLPYMNYLEVDLNFSLDYKNSTGETVKTLLERTEAKNVDSTNIRTLDSLDFLLHLCAHLYKEATTVPWIRMKRDMTFYKYCDIYALLHDFSYEQLDELLDRARELCLEKELAYCLNSINAFFGTKYSVCFDKNELNDVVAPSEKKIYRYIEDDPAKRFFTKDRFKLLSEAFQ